MKWPARLEAFWRAKTNLRLSDDSKPYVHLFVCIYIGIAIVYIHQFHYPVYLTVSFPKLRISKDEMEYLVATSNGQTICPPEPPDLEGPFPVDIHTVSNQEELSRELNHVEKGGTFKPRNCKAAQRLAVIIPLRDRADQLMILLKYLHKILKSQQRDYQIFVAEQTPGSTWNKGRLYNKAVDTIIKMSPEFSCFIFHDVDLIPENDRNIYECSTENPIHMSVAINIYRYMLMYKGLVGGCLAVSREQYIRFNGYSNEFWGWGGEDDDLFLRINEAGYIIQRPSSNIGRYKMIRHLGNPVVNDMRYELVSNRAASIHGGLDSLQDIDCRLIESRDDKLYTTLLIDVGTKSKKVSQLESAALSRSWFKSLWEFVRTVNDNEQKELYK
ncbi:unnamed protein product [Owenia fusiformis]|uniref:Beta-1,4-galactosyltransferase n=1 Tax=Owenia fusiformis TaxID=6347 RepID=A0A8S4Q5I8_OWEFU|nr:unnamed protein product [Owenia fusiformis]